MARFKTILEQAVALSRAGRPLRWQEDRLVDSVLGNGSGQGAGQSPVSGQGLGQAASKPVYPLELKLASASVQCWQATLRQHALKTGQRRGEWRGWGFGGKLFKKNCNERRKAGMK